MPRTAELSFDPTMLSVQSVSKDNSVFNLWTSNPSFSNTAGTVDYSGGSNNAYTGSAGDVVDVTFQALSAGSTSIKFSSASVLAADGQGTNVLGSNTGGDLYDRRSGGFRSRSESACGLCGQ